MHRTFGSAIVVPALFLILTGCSNAPMFNAWSRSDRAKPANATEKSDQPAEEADHAETPQTDARQDEAVAALDPETQRRIEQYLERFPDNELAQKLARPSDPPLLKKNNPKAPPTQSAQPRTGESAEAQATPLAKADDTKMPADTEVNIKSPAEPVAIVNMDPEQIPQAKVETDSTQQAAASDLSPKVGSNQPMEIKVPPSADQLTEPAQIPVVKKVGIVQPADIVLPAEAPTPKTNEPVVADAPDRELTLDDLIAGLEKKLVEAPNDIETQFKLRFLYAADDKIDKSAAVTPGMDQNTSEFLERMFTAIGHAKTAAKDPVTGADQALDSLNDLRQVVRRYAQLRIPKLEFCRKVDSYGVYEAHSPPVFFAQQGNRVIVYCEVGNFASEKTPDGLFKTQLSQRMEILTPNSHSEWKMEDENIVDVSRNRREDFFIIQIIDLPNSLAAGNYVLKVSIVDKLSNRAQEEFLEFTMQGATAGSSTAKAGQAFAGKPEE
jgi:hypothetical protein